MKTVYILGRQPEIGAAEIESIVGSEEIRLINNTAVVSNFDVNYFPFSRLGGSLKVGKILTTLPNNNWDKIIECIQDSIPQVLNIVNPTGKIKIGVSVYGMNISPNKINASALNLKKILKQSNVSVRTIPNKAAHLNSAQVIHNKLINNSNGWELLIIKDNEQTILAQTVDVQDIESYTARDRLRPKRDSRVGMLPPKLAQTIINFGSHGNNRFNATVLDPFCGTGVILQEALLMGFKAYGTDLDERMIEYTKTNIDWLKNNILNKNVDFKTAVADATNYKWLENFDFVAGETYLGRPLTQIPDSQTLNKIMNDCDLIHKKFLVNLADQIKPGLRICIAVPAWITKNGILHLKTLDYLKDLGYTRQSFVHVNNRKLIYYRDGQNVGRELVVLIRK